MHVAPLPCLSILLCSGTQTRKLAESPRANLRVSASESTKVRREAADWPSLPRRRTSLQAPCHHLGQPSMQRVGAEKRLVPWYTCWPRRNETPSASPQRLCGQRWVANTHVANRAYMSCGGASQFAWSRTRTTSPLRQDCLPVKAPEIPGALGVCVPPGWPLWVHPAQHVVRITNHIKGRATQLTCDAKYATAIFSTGASFVLT